MPAIFRPRACALIALVCAVWGLAAPVQAQTQQDRDQLQALLQDLDTDSQRGPSMDLLLKTQNGMPLARKVYGAESRDYLNYLIRLASLNMAMGRFPEAIPYLEEIVDTGTRIVPPENRGLLWYKSELGRLLALEDPYRGRKLAQEAYDVARAGLPDNDPLWHGLANNLAGILSVQNDHAAALPLQETLMSVQRIALTQGNPPNAVFLKSHLETLFVLGRFDQAVRTGREMMPYMDRVPPQFSLPFQSMFAANLIARNGAPEDLPEADAILQRVMTALPEPAFGMVDITLFGSLGARPAAGPGADADRPETIDVFHRALLIARRTPQIAPIYEAELVSSLYLLDRAYAGEVQQTLDRLGPVFGQTHPAILQLTLYRATDLLARNELDTAAHLAEQVETAARQTGLPFLESQALSARMDVAQRQNDLEQVVALGTVLLDKQIALYGPRAAGPLNLMSSLAQAYWGLNQFEESDAMMERGLAIASGALGSDHPTTAQFLFLKGQQLFRAQQIAEARVYSERALAISLRHLPPQDPMLILQRFAHLAFMLEDPYDPAPREAANALLDDLHAMGDATNPMIQGVGMLLAILDLVQTEDASQTLAQMNTLLDEFNDVFPGNGSMFAPFFLAPAIAMMEQDPIAGMNAIDAVRRRFGDAALSSFDQGSLAIMLDRAGLTSDAAEYYLRGLEQMLARSGQDPVALLQFTRQLAHLQLREPDRFDGYDVLDAFRLLQWPLERRAGRALALASERLSSTDPDLARQMRARQDLAAQIETQSTLLSAAYTSDDTDAVLNLQKRLQGLRDQQAAMEADMLAQHPGFGVIGGTEPMGTDAVAALLKPGEALLLLAPTQYTTGQIDVPGIAYLVRWDGGVVAEPLTENYIHSTLLRYLRCKIDWDRDFCIWESQSTDPAPEDPETLGSAQLTLGENGTRGAWTLADDDPGYDFDAAFELYTELIAPIEHGLIGVDHLIFVPGDETMAALPLGLLVRSPVPEGQLPQDSYRTAHWLIRDMAITMLPTVSSLAVQRAPDVPASRADQAFFGVGDPVIGRAGPMDCRTTQVAGLKRGLGEEVSASTLLSQTETTLSNVDRVRRLARLPDTRCELEEIRDRLGGGRLLLDQGATETAVKDLNRTGALSSYRVLSFATHGLVAGEAGASEPALVLTPPGTATQTDDGLLTASEIATFDLDADLVMLSACNTASGSNNGDESLSGLARAFFYAGARRLLVSHWPVNSDAAVALTTRTVDNLSTGRDPAFALQAAVLDILDDPDSTLRELRPQHWGPFSLVGTTR